MAASCEVTPSLSRMARIWERTVATDTYELLGDLGGLCPSKFAASTSRSRTVKVSKRRSSWRRLERSRRRMPISSWRSSSPISRSPAAAALSATRISPVDVPLLTHRRHRPPGSGPRQVGEVAGQGHGLHPSVPHGSHDRFGGPQITEVVVDESHRGWGLLDSAMTDSIEVAGMARASIPNPTSTPASPSARTGWSSTMAIDISAPWLTGSPELGSPYRALPATGRSITDCTTASGLSLSVTCSRDAAQPYRGSYNQMIPETAPTRYPPGESFRQHGRPRSAQASSDHRLVDGKSGGTSLTFPCLGLKNPR